MGVQQDEVGPVHPGQLESQGPLRREEEPDAGATDHNVLDEGQVGQVVLDIQNRMFVSGYGGCGGWRVEDGEDCAWLVSGLMGKSMKKQDPRPGVLVRFQGPPMASVSLREIVRPMPEPSTASGQRPGGGKARIPAPVDPKGCPGPCR